MPCALLYDVHFRLDDDAEAFVHGADYGILEPDDVRRCGVAAIDDDETLPLVDGGVADADKSSYLNISGNSEAAEAESLYKRMEQAAAIWRSDFDLESWTKTQLAAYLPVISGSRMLKDYLDYLF